MRTLISRYVSILKHILSGRVCDIEEENRNRSHPMFYRHLQLWTKCLRRRIPKITSPNQCQSRTSGADKTFGRTKSVPYAGTAYDESQFRTTDQRQTRLYSKNKAYSHPKRTIDP